LAKSGEWNVIDHIKFPLKPIAEAVSDILIAFAPNAAEG
jgi:hypothetical protein